MRQIPYTWRPDSPALDFLPPNRSRKVPVAVDQDDPYLNPSHRPMRTLSRHPLAAGQQERGVWRLPYHPPGMATFQVVTSERELVMRTDVAESQATEAFIENLWKWLDRIDEVRQIELLA
jgi:hypothetical protein